MMNLISFSNFTVGLRKFFKIFSHSGVEFCGCCVSY